jgi:glycerol-3-phosphate acyltransferase PlsY
MEINLIEILLMPGMGMLCGALPHLDIMQRLRPNSNNSRVIYLISFLKGILPALIGMLVFGSFQAMATGSAAALLMECFSPFARQRSRGLATALGAILVCSPFLLLLFAAMWLTGYGVIRRNYTVGIMSGILGTALLAPTTPQLILHFFQPIPFASRTVHTVYTICMAMPLLLRHLDPIRRVIAELSNEQEEPKA